MLESWGAQERNATISWLTVTAFVVVVAVVVIVVLFEEVDDDVEERRRRKEKNERTKDEQIPKF